MSVAVIANSRGLRSLSLKSDRHTDVKIIPNGVDTEYFIPSPNVGNRTGEYTFLFAGRLQGQKNVAVLLEAYSILIDRKIKCKLVIIGDGPLKAELVSKSKSIGAGDAVQWISWCSKDELRMYYQFADCFVNPSLYEGMANTVLEAWACGLPVLAGDCIGNRDIVQDNVNGKLFNPESADDLAGLLAYMVSHREIGILMGAAGRQLCVQKFSWGASAKEYMKYL
jgi:glycosyltransferase involved in cell wall biosynthesis